MIVSQKLLFTAIMIEDLLLTNALDAFRAGAEIIDASVLGLGERAGIVDLSSIT